MRTHAHINSGDAHVLCSAERRTHRTTGLVLADFARLHRTSPSQCCRACLRIARKYNTFRVVHASAE